MNAEIVYTQVRASMAAYLHRTQPELTPTERNNAIQNATTDPELFRWSDPALCGLGALAYAALDEMQKKAPTGNVYTLLKKVIKTTPDNRPDTCGVWTDDAGRACVCDGYRAIRAEASSEGLPVAKGWTGFGKILDDARTGCTEPLELPNAGTLKAFIAERRAAVKGSRPRRNPNLCFDLGEGLPGINAAFLLDMLAAGLTVVRYNPRSNYGPIWFESTDGRSEGVVMPMKKTTRAA